MIDRHNTPLVGSPDITLREVRDELHEPGFDPDVDAWLVSDEAGRQWTCSRSVACTGCAA